uniref:Protein TsetseEP domain-containing protein n=1 Tax=Dendroctonus ponderosae TaxID=77166 RepID=A0AAR5QE90_DENPD
MYTVVYDIKRSLAVFSALLLTVITTKVRAENTHCTADKLMMCAKPLSVLDSGLTLVSTKADLERICPDLKEAISCIHRYTRFCMKFQDRKNFKKLFHGTGEMVSNLCRNGTYQEEFLKYAPCMQTIEKENEVCFNQYNRKMNEIQAKTPMDDITQEDILISQEAFSKTMKRKRDAADEGIKNVCCSFQEYVECSTSTTRTACGSEAADFNRKFLDKMSSSMIQLHCQNYGPRECGFLSASSSALTNSLLFSLVLTVLSLIIR